MDGENPPASLRLDKTRLTNGDEGLVASLSIMELERRRADTLISRNGVTIILRKQDTAYDTSSFDARGWSERQNTNSDSKMAYVLLIQAIHLSPQSLHTNF